MSIFGSSAPAFGSSSTQTTSTPFGGFGVRPAANQQQSGSSIFGSSTQQQQGGGLFGSSSQPQQTGSIFGSTSQPQQTNNFGSSLTQQPSFGNNLGAGIATVGQSQQGGGLFGAGGNRNAQQTAQPAPVNATQQPQQNPGGSLFGTSQQQQPPPPQQIGSLLAQSQQNRIWTEQDVAPREL